MPQQDARDDDYNPIKSMERTATLLGILCQIWAFGAVVFLRKFGTWGDRFLGMRAVLGLLFIPVLGATVAQYRKSLDGLEWTTGLFFAAFVMLVFHRIGGVIRRSRGYQCHSRYDGVPWLMFGSTDELAVKRYREPTLVLFLGFASLTFSVPLGVYLIGTAVSLIVSMETYCASEAAQVRRMRDHRFEMERMAELMRRDE